LTKDTARTLARVGQASAVLLGAAAVGVAALGTPATVAPPAPAAAGGSAAPLPAPTPLVLPPADADTLGIAERFAQLGNAPQIEVAQEPPAEEPGIDEPPPEVAPPSRIADRVRYLGPVAIGQTMLAMVRVDEAQRVVRPGAVLIADDDPGETITLRAVREGEIVVGTDRREETIGRGQRLGTSMTLAGGGSELPKPPPFAGQANGVLRTDLIQPRSVIERPADLSTVVDERRAREEQRLVELLQGGTLTPEQSERIQSRLERLRSSMSEQAGQGGDR
jgi:hypothetical protein